MGDTIQHTVTAKDIHGKTYQISSAQLDWRPSAYGIVIKDDKLLLLRLSHGYDVPGGGIDLGESAEDAVLREIKEETGIIAANPRLLGVHNSYFKLPHEQDEFVQSLLFYYACDFVEGELSTDGFDAWEQKHAEEPEWFPIDKLDSITLAAGYDYRIYVKQLASK